MIRGSGGEVDLAGQLLAGFKIMFRHVAERVAFDGDDALLRFPAIALHDGKGEIAVAQHLQKLARCAN